MDPYRTLGLGYATRRRADPDIEGRVLGALEGCATVVNVGAGAGSYEPAGTVLAVEPSAVMIAQRPPGAVPVARAVAEALPLPDDAVDGALAVLTTHHWTDAATGIAELVRVARRQVVLTWDPALLARTFWLVAEYLPEVAERERDLACLDTVVGTLREHVDDVEVLPVPLAADCTDGVLAAHWCRPEAYLDPEVRAAASGLASLPDGVVRPALARLTRDLDDGTWHRAYGDLQGRSHLDVGYRLVIGRRGGW